MKIGFVYDVIYPETIGGIEKRIYEIGTRLARKGHEVHLYGMKCWEGPDTIIRGGLILHGVCPLMGIYTGGRRSILQAIRYSVHLIPVLMKSDLDIIDCQTFPYFSVFVSRFVSYIRHIPLVISWHEFWGSYWYEYLGPAGGFGYLIERLAVKATPRAISVSSLTSGQLREAGYSGDLHISPNGIPISQIRSVQPSGERSDIIFAGRFIPEKHPELVVEVVRELVGEFPDIRCVMIGDGPDYPEIVRMIDRYSLSGSIHCTGFLKDHNDMISLMKSSRIFVLPSTREGFGIVAIEAMACGLALVTVDHPRNAASAHVKAGTGYSCGLSVRDISAGIRIFLKTDPDKEEMNRYVAEHDWDTITTDLEEYYRLLTISPGSFTRKPEIPIQIPV